MRDFDKLDKSRPYMGPGWWGRPGVHYMQDWLYYDHDGNRVDMDPPASQRPAATWTPPEGWPAPAWYTGVAAAPQVDDYDSLPWQTLRKLLRQRKPDVQKYGTRDEVIAQLRELDVAS